MPLILACRFGYRAAASCGLDRDGWRLGFEGLGARGVTGAHKGELIERIAASGESLDVEHRKTLLRSMGRPDPMVVDRGRARPEID